jgi:sarcosine oxidase delta subunit
MICPKCNGDDFEDFEFKGSKHKICKKCGWGIQIQQSDEYDDFCKEQQTLREQNNSSNKPTVECPYCHSTNTKKITNTSKAIHTAIFGVFSLSRNSKQWHCNKCNSDF